MLKAPIPHNEKERLQELKSFEILDTLQDEILNDIVQVVADACEMPIAYISFIDSDRQWFKSIIGVDLTETKRDDSFCGHTILQDELLIVQDTYKDERFQDNPAVINDPKVRFYAGAPLISQNGFKLGTLCVADIKPNSLVANRLKC